ncbi:MAG: hypothetical protein HYV35_10135 [Lentisphaerae bacterium]|nr:hypothetical protein [Lentisphaerota bacterium]
MTSWLKPKLLTNALLIGIAVAVSVGRHSLPAVALTQAGMAADSSVGRHNMTATDSSDEITLAQCEQFFGLERNDDGGYLPKWLLAVAHSGEWQTDPPPLAFLVDAAQEENTGVLSLEVDRVSAGEDLVLELTYADAKDQGALFIGLSAWPEGAEADLFGNIMQGPVEEIVTRYFEIPIQSLAARYLSVDIYRGSGEIAVFRAALYTRSEFNYWLEQALVEGAAGLPGVEASQNREISRSGSPGRSAPAKPDERQLHPESGGSVEAVRQNRESTEFLSAEQIAAAVQVAADFMITRSVLSAGSGARMVSADGSIIMEATLAQPATVGFSYGSDVILHAGFQQSDDQELEIWNAWAVPAEFNPVLGEVSTLSYVLSTRSAGVTVEVYQDPVLITLVSNAPQGAGLQTVPWNGKDANGNSVAPGDWTNRIYARDFQGRVITTQVLVTIKQNKPVIAAVADAPDPFCPATDGASAIAYTTADFQNKNLDVTIAIEDAFGNPVANTNFPDQPPGAYSFDWNGSGAPREGLYIYRINARRGGLRANERTGTIILACNPECVESSDGAVRVCYQPNGFSIAISAATPGQVSASSYALLAASPSLLFMSRIYDIAATPATNFAPPAILSFEYDPAIIGNIGAKLELRRYDEATRTWELTPGQFIDYAAQRVIAEVTNLSLFALFTGERPAVLPATVRLEPEALNVNPGILTAFVSLPSGYPASGITSATCDGSLYERMMLNDDATEMIIKFRRRDIEAALAAIGETIDIYFIIRGVWQDAAGVSHTFEGSDSITKIVGGN